MQNIDEDEIELVYLNFFLDNYDNDYDTRNLKHKLVNYKLNIKLTDDEYQHIVNAIKYFYETTTNSIDLISTDNKLPLIYSFIDKLIS